MDPSVKETLEELNEYLNDDYNFQLTDEEFMNTRLYKEFDILGIIGSGGYGAVLKATNKKDKVTYAIKVIADVELEGYEIQALSKLDHPNIVKYNTAWSEVFDKKRMSSQSDKDSNKNSNERSSKSSIKSSCENSSENPNTSFSTNSDETSSKSSSEDSSENSAASAIKTSFGNYNQHSNESSTVCFVGSVAKKAFYKPMNTVNNISSKTEHTGYYVKSNPENESNVIMFTYIQQELCHKTLKDLMNDPTFFNTENHDTKWDILTQIFDGVAYVHSNFFIHRDLNPKNIFVKEKNSGYQIKIGDFGLAKFFDQNLLQAEEGATVSNLSHTLDVGTSFYMAPEVKAVRKVETVPEVKKINYDHKCDSYSLGIIMFELFYPFSTEMERIDVLGKLILENSKCEIEYPDDFDNHFHGSLRELDLKNIGSILKYTLQPYPENRLSAKTLSSLIDEYQNSRLFVKSGECKNVSARFRSMEEEVSRRGGYENEDLKDKENRSLHDLKITEMLRELQKNFNLHGINELPGDFQLSSSIEKHFQSHVLEFECFGYRIIKHAEVYTTFVQLNEKLSNSRTFGWGQTPDITLDGFERYGVVDYIAPVENAATLGAEMLFLIAQIPKCIAFTSTFVTLCIGHVEIFKAICSFYKCPLQKLQELMEIILLSNSRERLMPKLAAFLKNHGVDEQSFREIKETLEPQKDFETFEKNLYVLFKKSHDQNILRGLSEIEHAIKKFKTYYPKCEIEILYSGLLSYRFEFFGDGLSYALVYDYSKKEDASKTATKVICAGGRYDTYFNSKRQEEHKEPLCAYGLNIYVKELVFIKDIFREFCAPRNNILIYPDKWEKRAFMALSKLQEKDISSRIYYGKDVSNNILLKYCKDNNFDFLLKVIDNGYLTLYYVSGNKAVSITETFSENEDLGKRCRNIMRNKIYFSELIYFDKKTSMFHYA